MWKRVPTMHVFSKNKKHIHNLHMSSLQPKNHSVLHRRISYISFCWMHICLVFVSISVWLTSLEPRHKKTCLAYADQLRNNRKANRRLCFRYINNTIPLLPASENQASSHLLWLYIPVVLYLVRNPDDRFSRDAAHDLYTHFQKSRNYSVSSTPTTTDLYLFRNWGGQ